MQNIDPAVIQQFLDQYTNSSKSDSPLNPTINVFPQEFINLLSFGLIALTVISALFLIVYIFGTVRRWKVQSAVLDMHKDVKELKALLGGSKPAPTKIDKDTQKIA